jgi:hypothetical protein
MVSTESGAADPKCIRQKSHETRILRMVP